MTRLSSAPIPVKDLDLIIEEFSKPAMDDYTTIRNVLVLCPKRIKVQFALDSCSSIRHLMKDKRSTDALDAIQIYLDTGKPVPEEIRKAADDAADDAAAYAAAYAADAYAAYAAAYAAAAYAADAYAAAAAAYAADADAAAAAYKRGTPEWNRIKAEKMREHLNRLKDLILQYVPVEYDNFLLQVAL
jgi:hypothetical protein